MILSYSLISSVILAFGYMAYRVSMSGQSHLALNRGALLTTYALSLLTPFIILSMIMYKHPEDPGSGMIEIGALSGEITDAANGNAFNMSKGRLLELILKTYILGSLITAIYFLIGLGMLWRIIMRGEKTEFGTFSLILVENSCKTAPFSWGRSIVMTNKDYDEFGDMILLHEHAHLSHQHWLDLILSYATICLQWYNPAAWAMREELKAVHEYQADDMVIRMGVDKKEYQMLLIKKAAGYGYQSLANSLNHSKLKKRVTMMYKKKTSLKRRLFALALVPAIGAGIAVTAIPSIAGVLESLAETSVRNTSISVSEEPTKEANERVVYTAVEDMAEFPEGMEALMNWLCDNIRYPEAAQKADVQGRVIVKFVIEADGSVTNAEILRGVSPELDAEALRVIGEMPNWTPGKVNGKAVASNFTLPISFRLKDDKKEIE